MKSQLLLHENTSSSKRGQNLSQPSNLCPGSTLELHFQCSLFVQSHSVRSNSLREQVPFSSALARFSSPLELFPDRRAAIARMYVFICEGKLIACLRCGCHIFCANLLPCLWIYHASNPYSQNDIRTLSRPISQHPSSNRHGGGCCEALGYI